MSRRNSTQGQSHRDALRLVEGPNLAGHVVQHSDAYHLLIIDGGIVPCTPIEYPLLLHLLQQGECQLSLERLVQWARQHASSRLTRSSLRRHIRSVRAKLWPFGLDILCIVGYGYMLHATPLEQATPHELEMANLPA